MIELFHHRYKDLIPRYEEFEASLEKELPTGVRFNRLLSSSFSPEEWLTKKSKSFKRPLKSLDYFWVGGEKKFWGGALEHHQGLFYIQALSSLLPVWALEAKKHEMVLDMCAAPGGKSAYLAEKMQNSGHLVVNEPHLSRRRILKANLSRMGVLNGVVYGVDGQSLPFEDASFDKILLDGPCSSEGTFRKSDFIKPPKRGGSFTTYNEVFRTSLQKTQLELLKKAFALLKPGGRLVYSTCTYDPHENERQVDHLLKRNPMAQLVSLDWREWQEFLTPGCVEYQGDLYDASLKNTVRLYPHILDSIGFYVAIITKAS